MTFPASHRVVRFNESSEPEVSVIVCATADAPHLLGCLDSLARNVRDASYEVIVVLNAAEEEVERALGDSVRGAKLLRSRVNRGFAGGCNLGAGQARGRYLALLNDDAEVTGGWLEYLAEALAKRPRCGAVGSRVLHSDGSLQEAGSILWSDGSTSCVGRDLPADEPQAYNYARRVDFCGMSSMLVRKEVWDALDGLDESFFPAYCEDIDFCLRSAAAGWPVWYEPRSRIIHHESQSSSARYKTFLIERNKRLIRDRWGSVLGGQETANPGDSKAVARAVWRAMGKTLRLLVVDDRIPHAALGSGFARMRDAIAEIVEDEDFHISLLPTDTSAGDPSELMGLGVEIVYERLSDHLRRPGVSYDLAVVSRPHNFDQKAHLIRALLPECRIVYDAEAVYHRRLEKQLALASTRVERALLHREAGEMKELETQIAHRADHVVVLSQDEADVFKGLNSSVPVTTIEMLLRGVSPTTSPFRDRADIVMVASWLAGGPSSPNGDGLIWFVQHVLPKVLERNPWTRLRVTGAHPPRSITRLASPSVVFEGKVDDLAAFYDRARVVVVPVRFGAGVKTKTVEALQYAVPTVTTPVGAEGLDLLGTGALEITDDADDFADRVVRLLEDPPAWGRQRDNIAALLAKWSSHPDRPSWPAVLRGVLNGAESGERAEREGHSCRRRD